MLKRILLLLIAGSFIAPLQAEPMTLLIPMYFYPRHYEPANYQWDDVAAAAEKVPVVAIVNPENGPGTGGPNSDYDVGLKALRDAGIKMIGYVSSDYARTDINVAKSMVDEYINNWPDVTGIFVDEVENDTIEDGYDYLAYYTALSQHIRSYPQLDLIVLNPGTDADHEYLDVGDVIVSFESQGFKWEDDETDSLQTNGEFPASRFAALVYDSGALDRAAIDAWVNLTAERNYGYLQFTDDPVWQALPTYFGELVDSVACKNGNSASCPANDANNGSTPSQPSSGNSGGGSVLFLPLLLGLLARRVNRQNGSLTA